MLNFAPRGPSLITKIWRDGLIWTRGYVDMKLTYLISTCQVKLTEMRRYLDFYFYFYFFSKAGRRSHRFTGSSWDKMKWNANLLREAITTRSPSWSPRRDSPSARDATLCANCGSDWTRPSHVILPLCVYNARRAWPMCALLPISQRNATKPNANANSPVYRNVHTIPNANAKPLSKHTTPESPNSPLTHSHNPEPCRARDFMHCWWGMCEIVRFPE